MKIEMLNKRFGRLVVIAEAEKTKDNHKRWLCQCDCGNCSIVDGRDLRKNATRSCGCFLKEETAKRIKKINTKHGDSNTRLYFIWQNMNDRCRRKNNKNYDNYGGRGIKVCDDWQEYSKFKVWALNNGYTNALTIDRINVNGNYEPSNCRWVTMTEQANNKRINKNITFNNITLTVTQWNRKMGYTRGLIEDRLLKGWTIERAITEPPFIGKNQHFKKIQKESR